MKYRVLIVDKLWEHISLAKTIEAENVEEAKEKMCKETFCAERSLKMSDSKNSYIVADEERKIKMELKKVRVRMTKLGLI